MISFVYVEIERGTQFLDLFRKKAFERKLLQSTWKIDLNRLHGCPRQNTRVRIDMTP